MKSSCHPADIDELFKWIIYELSSAKNENIMDILSQYLQNIFTIEKYRHFFLKYPNGLQTILEILKNVSISPQIQYQCISCVWLLSFVPQGAADFSKVYQVVPVLKDIAKTAIKEKVIRVIIATFKVL